MNPRLVSLVRAFCFSFRLRSEAGRVRLEMSRHDIHPSAIRRRGGGLLFFTRVPAWEGSACSVRNQGKLHDSMKGSALRVSVVIGIPLLMAGAAIAVVAVRRPDFEQACNAIAIGQPLADVRTRLDATGARYRAMAPRQHRWSRWVWSRFCHASCNVWTDESNRVTKRTLTHDLL